MNRIDTLKDLRTHGEGILSLTLPPNCMWDFNRTFELIDMMRSAGMNQLLELVCDPDASKMAEIAPIEVELLKRGMNSGYRTEMISTPMYKIRERYPNLPLLTTAHIGEMFCYGQKRFLKKCVELGIDGMDTCAYQYVDDPIGFRKLVESMGIYHITAVFAKIIDSSDPVLMNIVEKMVENSTGELFVVPGMLGHHDTLTGEQMKVYIDFIREKQAKLGRYVPLIAIGGVRSPEAAYDMVHNGGLDGVHSSSAFMAKLLSNEPLEKIESYLREFKDAVNG